MTIVEMTKKHLEFCINLADKTAAGVKGLTLSLKQVLLWVNAIKQDICYKEIFCL